MCLVSGLNANTIANSVVAEVTVTLAARTSGPSVALGFVGALVALPNGSAETALGTGGTITVRGWTDSQPPSAPMNLSTAASVTQIVLAWTASTDNVGVTGYLVERCQGAGCSSFAQVVRAGCRNRRHHLQ
jgi:hypothetical protein